MNRRRNILLLTVALLVGVCLAVFFYSYSSRGSEVAKVNTQDKHLPPADPIYSLLPHYEQYYQLQSQPNGANKPNIVFTYLAPPSYDPAAQQGAPTEQQALSQAKNWLQQKGINANKYNIITAGS